MADLDPANLIFIDEAGSHLGMSRDYGRSERGQRTKGKRPANRRGNITLIGALSLGGVDAIMTVDGGTTKEVFLAFVRHMLKPILGVDKIVVLDNVGAHKAKGIKDEIESTGAKVLYLPPYAPDLNPIEECWSKIKSILRTSAARTRKALDEAIAAASYAVSSRDASGWFAHAGYA